MIHFAVPQKLTHRCKATILQLKKEKESPLEFFLIIILNMKCAIWNVDRMYVHFSLPGGEWTALFVTLVLIRRKCTHSFSEAVRPSTTWRTGALARMSRFLPFCCCWLPPPPTVRVITAVQIFISCLLCVSHWASLKTSLPDLCYSPHFTDEETETQKGSEETET